MIARESKIGGTDAGYTILEVLIVLVVLAASAAIVAPRVSASRDASVLEGAGARLAAAMAVARASSISGSSPRYFILDPARRAYGADREKPLKKLAPGIAMSASGFPSELGNARMHVRFNPDGTATGGAIILRKSRSAISISVDWLTGAVRIKRLG